MRTIYPTLFAVVILMAYGACYSLADPNGEVARASELRVAQAESSVGSLAADAQSTLGGDPERQERNAGVVSETEPTENDGATSDLPEHNAVHPDVGRCSGWAKTALRLACQAAKSGRVVKTLRESLMWQATVPFKEGATVVQVDLPEDVEPAATSIGLQIVHSDGGRSNLGRAAAVFALDNPFEVVHRDQVGARHKPAIDVSDCEALQGGWALYADEFLAYGDTWHVVLEPPGSMASKISQFPWGESMHFVVVTYTPDCAEAQAAATRASAFVASSGDQDLSMCGGGSR